MSMSIAKALEDALKQIGKSLNSKASEAIISIHGKKNGDYRIKMTFIISKPPEVESSKNQIILG